MKDADKSKSELLAEIQALRERLSLSEETLRAIMEKSMRWLFRLPKEQKFLRSKVLKEIHHRVKNNLGIVSSLLQMQIRRTHNPQTTIVLQDNQNRIIE